VGCFFMGALWVGVGVGARRAPLQIKHKPTEISPGPYGHLFFLRVLRVSVVKPVFICQAVCTCLVDRVDMVDGVDPVDRGRGRRDSPRSQAPPGNAWRMAPPCLPHRTA
jgi:hypothetical protein